MKLFSDRGNIPTLLSGPVGTSTCAVKYTDGTVANIPFTRFIWERENGRLKAGFRVIQVGNAKDPPSVKNLQVILRDQPNPAVRARLRTARMPFRAKNSPESELVNELARRLKPREIADGSEL